HTRFSRDWSSDVCSSDLGSDLRLRHQNPFGVEASITNSDIVSDATVSVNAVSSAEIIATVDSSASASYEALFDGRSAATGAVIEIGRASCREGAENRVHT